MTEEELKKEAEEKAKKRTRGFKCQDNCEKSYVMGALDFAEPREKQIAELEMENADLKCECRRCVYSDTFCIVSDYGKDKNGICDHFKDVFDENAELRKDFIESEEDNNKLRENIQKLAVAKEIMEKLKALYLSPVVTKDDVKRQDEILAEAEQFLNEK